jgi:hypothetical protein
LQEVRLDCLFLWKKCAIAQRFVFMSTRMEENELLEIWQEAGCVKSRVASDVIHSRRSVSGRNLASGWLLSVA